MKLTIAVVSLVICLMACSSEQSESASQQAPNVAAELQQPMDKAKAVEQQLLEQAETQRQKIEQAD